MKISKCSNSGKVAVENLTDNDIYAGGVAGHYGVKEGEVCTRCFNTGTISIKQMGGKYSCGGVFGDLGGDGRELYNTGKVSGKKESLFVGGVLGSYDNAMAQQYGSYFIRDNYSTTSPLYGYKRQICDHGASAGYHKEYF